MKKYQSRHQRRRQKRRAAMGEKAAQLRRHIAHSLSHLIGRPYCAAAFKDVFMRELTALAGAPQIGVKIDADVNQIYVTWIGDARQVPGDSSFGATISAEERAGMAMLAPVADVVTLVQRDHVGAAVNEGFRVVRVEVLIPIVPMHHAANLDDFPHFKPLNGRHFAGRLVGGEIEDGKILDRAHGDAFDGVPIYHVLQRKFTIAVVVLDAILDASAGTTRPGGAGGAAVARRTGTRNHRTGFRDGRDQGGEGVK